jgi:hypothetical protein
MPRVLPVPAVPNFRCYYLDSDNHVVSTGLIQCDSDAQAQACADILLAASLHAGIEVWDGPWKVYHADKPE